MINADTPTTRHLIQVIPHGGKFGDSGGEDWDEVDLGPATPEQIAASDAEPSGTGLVQINEAGLVVGTIDFGDPDLRLVYVEAEV